MEAMEWIEIDLPYGPSFDAGPKERDSFSRRGLNIPGTQIRMADDSVYLIGTINTLRGVCDDCTAFDPDAIVSAYRVVWTPEST